MLNFDRIASGVNIYPLLEQLEANAYLWKQITVRQAYEGSSHRDTESIFLRWCPTQTVEAAFTEIDTIDYPASLFLSEARALVKKVFSLAEGRELGRVLIVNLKAGGVITPHADEGIYADHFERFHLALSSEEGNIFICGHERVHMNPGELWWFNHKCEHSVMNNSDKPRIHLIVDAVSDIYQRERKSQWESSHTAPLQ